MKNSFENKPERTSAELCGGWTVMNAKLSNNGIPRWKRRLDLALILLTLPILVPLMILIAILIRVSSAGPILFQQERIGFRGHKFMCLKFRTMICGADVTTHQGHLESLMTSDVPMTKMDAQGDSRIILPGKWLRASGLDELPQLINVLKGQMSLVGPRPCLSYEANKYLPWQRERFESAPGLTGLWQVSGKNQTTFVEMIRFDIYYARHKTLWLDLKIILKTIPALLVQMWELKRRKKLSRAVTSQAVLRAR